jgi:HlyD family secretion protein
MKWLRRGIVIALAAGGLVLLVLAFRPKPVAVEVATVERGEFVEYVEEPGKTRVRERFVVSAPVTGELDRIRWKAGDMVGDGQDLVRIRPVSPAMLDARTRSELAARLSAAQAAQARASAAVDRARSLDAFAGHEVQRLRVLATQQAATERELERAELERDVAQKDVRSAELSAKVAAHELEVARAALATGGSGKGERGWTVKAPLKGRVLRVLVPNEAVVASGTPLIEIADVADLEVVVSMLTSDAIRLGPGSRSFIERWGGPPLEGRVRAVEPSGYTKLSALGVEEQRVDVLIDIASPTAAWANLGDGFRVHTRTVVHREPHALKTAAAALFRDGEAWALFVIERDRASKRRVVVERRSGMEAVLGAGLEPGTRVVAFPSNTLADGAKVSMR